MSSFLIAFAGHETDRVAKEVTQSWVPLAQVYPKAPQRQESAQVESERILTMDIEEVDEELTASYHLLAY
ncbi:hypothetical protein Nepgr_026903 [Nepenthes gracilis]|uniref:Uncharacterized protein n=1 Tax=Nepenthes gracilis TaxID=150966 RepID=A0AAD3T8W1_NEPGR|nr:hypothetical protein Nepgr_026903 [Nepenthes gracilis]